MTRKKSNVKALALAVTCAILAGGGIGLEPVYAVDALYKENSTSHITADATGATGNTDTATKWKLTVIDSGLKIGGIDLGLTNSNAITIGSNTITATDVGNWKSVYSTVGDNNTNGTLAYNTQKIRYNATTGTTVEGAITAESLTLADNYNVKTNIEDAKSRITVAEGKITTVEGNLSTNQANLTALQGRVDGHDTEINALKTKTQDIKYENDGSTTVDGVNFNGGAVSGVTSINNTHVGGVTLSDGTIEAASGKFKVYANGAMDASDGAFIVSSAGTIKALGIQTHSNGSITLNDKLFLNAADASLQDQVTGEVVSVAEMANTRDNTQKISYNDTEGTKIDSDVIINAGKKNQVKITEGEGIVVGLNSSVINDDGVFAGGHDYAHAKAALNANDGALKAAGDKFEVDKDGNVKTEGNIQGNDITATGALNVAKDAAVGGTLAVKGATTLDSTLAVNGNTTVGGTLDVTGKTTLKNELQVNEKATFGIAIGSQTFIEGDLVKTGRIETSDTQASRIGGVILQNGQITADSMTINGAINLDDLTVKNQLTVGDFVVDKTGAVTGLQSINGVAVAKSGTGLTIGSATIGDANPFRSTGFKVDNVGNVEAVKVTAGTITDGNGFTATGGNVTATGTVQGKAIYDGVGAKLENGKITANEGKIGNVVINAAGEVSGVSEIKASTFKVDDNNFLNNNGITAKGGTIGVAVINETTLAVGNTKLDTESITTHQLKIRDMSLTDARLTTGDNQFEVNGVVFKQGQVTAQDDKGFVAGNSSFKQYSLIVDAKNKLETTDGLTTEKATVTGTLDVNGLATFGTASDQTTINGKIVTTDTLKANKLVLGTSGTPTVEVDQNGSLKAAGGKFEVDKDGALKAANGAFYVDKDGKTTFTKDDDNLSSINGGNILAKATDDAAHTSSELNHTYKGLHVSGTQAGKTSAFDFDTSTGISTFTGQDSTTTTVNGSVITSTKSATDTGVLDGSNLTLTNGTNSTALTAGGATFTGANGRSDATGVKNQTTIDGGIITTDTLNVQRIELGDKLVDKNGTAFGSNLSMDNQGNFSAAGGSFKVTGGSGEDKGAMTNTVGNTTLQTGTTGASMKFNNTAADGGVTSEVAVEANKATVAAGDKASFVATTDNGGTATITGGTQTVTTTDKGTVFENTAHKNPFVENGATNTIINGNEITTGKITTDELVITGKGDAAGPGTGSLAFGGNGTIKSDVKEDGSTNNTQFTTDIDGVKTKVTDGKITTENNVSAAGNSNTVTNGDNKKSEFNQDLTSIGGVVTNGEIKVAQKLDGATGLLTNEVTDADGKSSMLKQSGTGLTYTDSANTGNETRINSSDVSIGSASDPDKRINLSDLGQIDELDQEIRNNEEYQNNKTAVGGINAEAAIRRGEVERLDNRISEEVTRLDGRINDVNDRVNKVGAMAAAIASLKSIGYDPQAPSEFSIGLGQYKGETGVAMGFFHYPNKNFMINVSLSTAGGETMGGIGATWRFGHKSPQKLLEEQREAQAKKELAAAEKYQAAAKLAKEAQERAEYAAKLARQAQVSADNAKAAADATQAKHFG